VAPEPDAADHRLLAFPQLIKAWKYDPHAPETRAYYTISAKQRFEYVAMYLGLAATWPTWVHETHQMIGAATP